MLGLLLIYFIGKYFYKLAEDHNKSQWGFAVLGVVMYYVGIFIGAGAIALLIAYNDATGLDDINEVMLGLAGVPFGLLACWIFYKILQKNWSNKNTSHWDTEVLDSEILRKEI